MIQRYLRTIFCLSFLVASLELYAQKMIKPFEDYSKCMTGFLKPTGDTLYHAQFEGVQEFLLNNHDSKKAWIVRFSDKVGCIDENGKWLVECNYRSVFFHLNERVFVVRNNNGYGVLNSAGSVLLPCNYQNAEIYDRDQFSYIKTTQNGLNGAFDLNGKEIVPEGSYFNRYYLKSLDSSTAPKVYYVFNKTVEGKNISGIRNENGDAVVADQRNQLYFIHFHEQVLEDEQVLLVENDKGYHALTDLKGKLLTDYFPDPELNIEPIPSLKPGSNSIHYTHARLENHRRADEIRLLNIKTKKQSEVYDRIYPYGDYFIAFRKEKQFLLDADLNVRCEPSGKHVLLSFDSYSNDLLETEYFNVFFAWGEETRVFSDSRKFYELADEVLILAKKKHVSRNEKKHDIGSKFTYQILQPKTGEISDKKYSEVYRAASNNGIFIWAMNPGEKDSLLVDIYSFEGNYLRSLTFSAVHGKQIKEELSKYRSEEEGKLLDQSFWVSSGGGKYKGIHHSGMVLTGNNFEENAELVYSDNKSRHIIRERSYGSDFKYYDQNHDPLYIDEYYSDTINLNHQGYYMYTIFPDEENGYSTAKKKADALGLKIGGLVLDREFNIICDSAMRNIYVSQQSVLNVKEKNLYMFQIGEYMYVYTEGKLKALDSTMFKDSKSVNQVPDSHYRVDASGKLYFEPEKPKPPKPTTNSIYRFTYVLNSGTLTISDEYNLVNVIPDVETYVYEYEQTVWVQMKGNKQGLLNAKTGKWMFKPTYEEIKEVKQYIGDRNVFWARNTKENDGKWFPMNASGKVLAKPIFDQPFHIPYAEKSWSFNSYGKIGIIDSNFKVLVSPTFDKQIYTGNFPVYFKDNQPYLVFKNGKVMEIKKDISDCFLNKGKLFLYNDSIEVYSDEGTVLVPPMPIEKAMKSYNLCNLFFFPSKQKLTLPYTYNSEVFCASNDLAMRYYSNHVIIEEALTRTKAPNELQYTPSTVGFYQAAQCKIEPLWISKNICVERVYGKCFPESARANRNTSHDCGYRVYKISKDTCIQLGLEDLIKTDEVSVAKLNQLIRDEIQRKQSFGLVCSDMDGAVEEFKQHFSLDHQYLYLTNYSLNESLALKLLTIKDILGNPEWFN